jgi:hypothetical protein
VNLIASPLAFATLLITLLATPVEAAGPKISRAPRGFAVLYETSNGERIDTSSGRVTKDLVVDPDTTIALKLTAAELDTLYSAIVQLRLLKLPEPHPQQDRGSSMDPYEEITLRIRTASDTRTFSWSTTYRSHVDAEDEWRRLSEFIGILRRLPQNHRAYRALPRPRGAYL